MANPILMELPLNGSLAGRDRDGVFTATGSGALRYAPAEGARINYMPNGSAENAATFTQQFFGSGSGGTVTRYTTDSSHGLACARVANLGTSAWMGGYIYLASSNNPEMRFLRTKQVWCKFKWKAVTSNTVYQVGIRAWSVGTSSWLVDDYDLNVTPPEQWTDYVLGPISIPADSDNIQLFINGNSSSDGTAAFDFLVDEVMFTTEDPTGWDYFDGSTSGCSWFDPTTGQSGTAWTSPSCNQLTAWIEEGTTNLIANPSAEYVDTSYWGEAAVTTTLAKDTSIARYGSVSIRAECEGVTVAEGAFASTAPLSLPTGAQTFIGSIDAMGEGEVYCFVAVFYTDASSDYGAGIVVSLADQWQRIVTPTITSNPGKSIQNVILVVQTYLVAQAVTFWVDGAQVENKAYATSYCDGSLGTGYSWTGTAHASASTRDTCYVTAGDALDVLGESEGSLVFGCFEGNARQSNPFFWFTGSWENSFLGISRNMDGYHPDGWYWEADPGAGFALLSGDNRTPGWYSTAMNWSADGTALYQMEGSPIQVANDADPVILDFAASLTPELFIGHPSGGSGVYIGPLATYDRPLTDTELTKVSFRIDNGINLWSTLADNNYGLFQIRPVGA